MAERYVHLVFSHHLENSPLATVVNRLLERDAGGDPHLSWYEPRPGSLLESRIETAQLHPLLRQGPPDQRILETVETDEVKLFWPDGAVFVHAMDGNRCRWFSWRADAAGQSFLERRSPVILKADTTLKQYGISPMPSCPQRLTMIRYYSDSRCVAWTLINETNGEADAKRYSQERDR